MKAISGFFLNSFIPETIISIVVLFEIDIHTHLVDDFFI